MSRDQTGHKNAVINLRLPYKTAQLVKERALDDFEGNQSEYIRHAIESKLFPPEGSQPADDLDALRTFGLTAAVPRPLELDLSALITDSRSVVINVIDIGQLLKRKENMDALISRISASRETALVFTYYGDHAPRLYSADEDAFQIVMSSLQPVSSTATVRIFSQMFNVHLPTFSVLADDVAISSIDAPKKYAYGANEPAIGLVWEKRVGSVPSGFDIVEARLSPLKQSFASPYLKLTADNRMVSESDT